MLSKFLLHPNLLTCNPKYQRRPRLVKVYSEFSILTTASRSVKFSQIVTITKSLVSHYWFLIHSKRTLRLRGTIQLISTLIKELNWMLKFKLNASSKLCWPKYELVFSVPTLPPITLVVGHRKQVATISATRSLRLQCAKSWWCLGREEDDKEQKRERFDRREMPCLLAPHTPFLVGNSRAHEVLLRATP